MTTRVRVVPNQPKTPMHSFRCSDQLWEDAKRVAGEREETVADVLRKALERYVKRGAK
jgi:Lon protease-like protein